MVVSDGVFEIVSNFEQFGGKVLLTMSADAFCKHLAECLDDPDQPWTTEMPGSEKDVDEDTISDWLVAAFDLGIGFDEIKSDDRMLWQYTANDGNVIEQHST